MFEVGDYLKLGAHWNKYGIHILNTIIGIAITLTGLKHNQFLAL